MTKRVCTLLLTLLLSVGLCCTAFASDIPVQETPDYKVAFYAFDCFNMQDENGVPYGYGYDMMQGLAKYLQCTFSYVGYDKTAAECVEMLRNGDIDIYTAARLTPERQAEFAISSHPAITANTCMNVKVNNTSIVAGDYSTYEGIRIGLLRRHTYNDKFLAFADSKGFDYTIVYYETPTELSSALVNGEVDALVNSYFGIPEDERTIEDFGPTPYYLMARKEDQALIDQLDYAIDCMNVETPNWRTDLYNRYYGAQDQNNELTKAEAALLDQLQANNTTVRAVMNPDGSPYAWYDEDGLPHGIAADMFIATVQELGLRYEVMPVQTREEYLAAIQDGQVDVWIDVDGRYKLGEGAAAQYKLTDPYLSTTVSVLRRRGATGSPQSIAVVDDCGTIRDIISDNWPNAKIITAQDTEECQQLLLHDQADGVLLMTYTAQELARNDVQNRFRVDIVPDATLDLQMGVNATLDRNFYGLWKKTLAVVSPRIQDDLVQTYANQTTAPTLLATLFDHPSLLLTLVAGGLLLIFALVLLLLSIYNAHRHKQTAETLSAALDEAQKANLAKQDFFSKMSHDIRTPLNVVLGMTQVAQKYKDDPDRLSTALENITYEGNYLLSLINSILDVNQLEHGRIELLHDAFSPTLTMETCINIMRPMAEKKDQQLTLHLPDEHSVVVGDKGRCSQIVTNIVSNAIKYTPNGGHIDVTLEALPNDRMRFICKDDGIGMTKEFVAHITEDYTRAEDSRVSKVQGTGLGMSVVKGFVDLMNGTLQIESEPGKGSTFIVEIPFEKATAMQRMRVLNPPHKQENAAEEYTGKKALLAEDNSLNAEIAIELLQTMGLTIDWVENGAIAVNRLNNSKPGEYFAVFMDMQMPVMDGVEATRQIRASSHPDHNLPIFAMTANTFASDRQRCFDAGMSGYIPKPISIGEISTVLHTTISAAC